MKQENYILEDINNIIAYAEESNYQVKKRIDRTYLVGTIATIFTATGQKILEEFVDQIPEGATLIPLLIIFGIIVGFAVKRLTRLSNMLYIDKKNADQILKLHNLISKTDGLKSHKRKIIKNITNKTKCFGVRTYKKRKLEGEDIKPPEEKECAKDMLNAFIKELDNYNLEPDRKKEIINEIKKLKRELVIKK